jgi:hypothetical protein
MTSHYTQGSVTTLLHDFGGLLGRGPFFWALTTSWSRLLAHVWSGTSYNLYEIELPINCLIQIKEHVNKISRWMGQLGFYFPNPLSRKSTSEIDMDKLKISISLLIETDTGTNITWERWIYMNLFIVISEKLRVILLKGLDVGKVETPHHDNDLIPTPIISPQSGW